MSPWPIPQPAVRTAIAVLRGALDPTTGVGANKPRIWPRLFVRVSRAGGGQELIVTDTARILVECYGDSDAACETLTNQCRAALRNTTGRIVNGVFLRGYDNEAGPVTMDDPKVADHRRWQFQGDLLVSTNEITPMPPPVKPPVEPRNEQQLITIDGNPNNGTYLLGFLGEMCDPPLKYNANATAMEEALCACSTVGVGNLTVGKDPDGPLYYVEFINDLGAQNVPLLDVDYSNLNRGSVVVTAVIEGAP